MSLLEYVGSMPLSSEDPLGLRGRPKYPPIPSTKPIPVDSLDRLKELLQDECNKCGAAKCGLAKCLADVDRIYNGLMKAAEDIKNQGGPVRFRGYGAICNDCAEAVESQIKGFFPPGVTGACFSFRPMERDWPDFCFYDHNWGELTTPCGTSITIDFWYNYSEPWHASPLPPVVPECPDFICPPPFSGV